MGPLADIKRLSLFPHAPNEGVEENWCLTDNILTRLSCAWTITNFSYYKTGQTAFSPEFTSKTDDRLKWKLVLCLESLKIGSKYDIKHEEVLMIGPLFTKFQHISELKINCTFSILKANGQEAEILNFRDSITSVPPGPRRLIERDRLFNKDKGLLQNDKLTIFCRIDVLIDFKQYSGEVKRFEWKIPACTLADDLTISLKDDQFSDVTIHVNGREFKAHKFIMAARSPVFRKMFTSLMREKTLSQVDVFDVKPEVFEEMLNYMYTGTLSFDSESVKQEEGEEQTIDKEHLASELLKVAEKYQLDGLKVICEKILGEGLTIHTAAETLALADFYNAQQLKAKTIEFIIMNVGQVLQTDGWKKVVIESLPGLVAEVFAEHISSMEPACKEPEKSKEAAATE